MHHVPGLRLRCRNFLAFCGDWTGMDCITAREALSAVMDGEEPPSADPAAVDDHVHRCDACLHWVAAAERIDRAARVGPAAPPARDLAPEVLAAVRLPRTGRRIRVLRAALLVTALAQIALGFAGFADGLGMSMHAMAMPVPAHMSHELVAFNVAMGVALLVVAARIDRARAQIPALAVFVAVLAAVSVADLASGQVGWTRLATHVPIVVGLVLSACAARVPVAPGGPETPVAVGMRGARSEVTLDAVLQHAEQRHAMGGPPSPAAHTRGGRHAA